MYSPSTHGIYPADVQACSVREARVALRGVPMDDPVAPHTSNVLALTKFVMGASDTSAVDFVVLVGLDRVARHRSVGSRCLAGSTEIFGWRGARDPERYHRSPIRLKVSGDPLQRPAGGVIVR